MKGKILVSVVVMLFFMILAVSVVMAEGYQESSCSHYIQLAIPGPLGESAVWVTTDPALISTNLGSYNLAGRTFVIAHSPFSLDNVPVNNTWGCYYTGGDFPSQTRVDEITSGLNPLECVFVDNGEIFVNKPVNGSCTIPNSSTPTLTSTPTQMETIEPTTTPPPVLNPGGNIKNGCGHYVKQLPGDSGAKESQRPCFFYNLKKK